MQTLEFLGVQYPTMLRGPQIRMLRGPQIRMLRGDEGSAIDLSVGSDPGAKLAHALPAYAKVVEKTAASDQSAQQITLGWLKWYEKPIFVGLGAAALALGAGVAIGRMTK